MVILRPKTIKEKNANKVASAYSSFCKNNSSCLYKNKKRKYHGWLNLSHLSQKNKVAQCGWDNGDCNHDTHYGIGGYHNVCPIAGINGDYVWPAKLQLSDFDFKNNNITSISNIKSIAVHLEHRMVAINTKTGVKYENFGPTFHSQKGWVAKIYFSHDDDKISKVITCDSNPKLSKKKFSSFSCTFKDVNITELLNNKLKLNIEYNHNYNTNPGIIYLKNVYIDVNFDDADMYIDVSADKQNLYTSEQSQCRTTITHTVEAGYKNQKTKISPSNAPKKLGSKIKCIKKPDNVTVTEKTNQSTDSQKVFQIKDSSGIEGEKEIIYSIDGYPKKEVSIKYSATKRDKPKYSIVTKYKFNEDYNSSKSYIIFNEGCASQISIYIDSIQNEPLVFNISDSDNPNNLLTDSQIEIFHTTVKQLSCGLHTLYIRRDNETITETQKNKVVVSVEPMNFKFNIYTNETPDHQLNFIQTKDNINRYSNIIIERVDNEPIEIIPSLSVYDETRPSTVEDILQITKKSKISHTIDRYYAGEFYVTIKNDSSFCPSTIEKSKITITSHKQNYDYIFTRGELGTGFDFDYLVAWEGDNVKKPIEIDDIEMFNSKEDIRICSDSVSTGLFQVGLIQLRIQNKTNKDMQGVEIELNTLIEDDNGNKTVTTQEWVNSDGIFKEFYTLFKEYNMHLNDNVKVLNLTPDNDLVDEENVYLLINRIDAHDTITIYLPFKSVTKKEVFLQYLLFEEPLSINNISNCESQEESDNNYISVKVYDSMLTNLEIIGQTDLLKLNHNAFECPKECYTTNDHDEFGNPSNNLESGGITYRITNIDTNDFSNQTVKTKIINDPELKPYGYILNETYYPLLDNNGNEVSPATTKLRLVQKDSIVNKNMKDQFIFCNVQFPNNDSTKLYSVKTNKNGLAEFFIPIPNTITRTYTVNELLSESVLTFEFRETKKYNYSKTLSNDQIALDPNKNKTNITYGNNFKRYKPGETAYIPVFLSTDLQVKENYFEFDASLKDINESDEITILYKICNINNNKGIFKTTFKTNDEKKLIPNSVTKNIYCGVPTEIDLKVKIEKELIELTNLNVLYINVTNQVKENKDVNIQIELHKRLYNYLGNYDFFDITMSDGDYSIIETENGHTINWLIGEMDSFEKQQAIIKIKAVDIGLSDIHVKAFDYLNDIELIDSICPKCQEENKWRPKNSLWRKINNKWYKYVNGRLKEPVMVKKSDGTYEKQWVDKE